MKQDEIQGLLKIIADGNIATGKLGKLVIDIAKKIYVIQNNVIDHRDVYFDENFVLSTSNTIRVKFIQQYHVHRTGIITFPSSYLYDPDFEEKERIKIEKEEAQKREDIRKAMAEKDKLEKIRKHELYLALKEEFENK